MSNWYITPSDSDLMHFGILGMKWGVRRFQNPDGSLTEAGRKRYGKASYLLNNNKKVYKNTKELDAAANEISKKIGKEEDIGDGIKSKYVEYGTIYTKKLNTDIGNIYIDCEDEHENGSNIPTNEIKSDYKRIEKVATKLMKDAANKIIKDEDILDGWMQELQEDENGKLYRPKHTQDTVDKLIKGLQESEKYIYINKLKNTSKDTLDFSINFNPYTMWELGGHTLTFNATMDKNGNVRILDKKAQLNG